MPNFPSVAVKAANPLSVMNAVRPWLVLLVLAASGIPDLAGSDAAGGLCRRRPSAIFKIKRRSEERLCCNSCLGRLTAGRGYADWIGCLAIPSRSFLSERLAHCTGSPEDTCRQFPVREPLCPRPEREQGVPHRYHEGSR